MAFVKALKTHNTGNVDIYTLHSKSFYYPLYSCTFIFFPSPHHTGLVHSKFFSHTLNMLHALYPYFNSYTGFQLILKPQHDFHLCISHRFCLLTLQRVETTDLEVWAQGYPGDRCCRFRRCRRRKTSRTWCLDKGMSSVPTNLQHLHWLYKSNTHSATHSRDITWRRISDRLTDGWADGRNLR